MSSSVGNLSIITIQEEYGKSKHFPEGVMNAYLNFDYPAYQELPHRNLDRPFPGQYWTIWVQSATLILSSKADTSAGSNRGGKPAKIDPKCMGRSVSDRRGFHVPDHWVVQAVQAG